MTPEAILDAANRARYDRNDAEADALMCLLRRTLADDACLCGSGKPWVSRLEHQGRVSTECEDCWPRHERDHDRCLDLEQEEISL